MQHKTKEFLTACNYLGQRYSLKPQQFFDKIYNQIFLTANFSHKQHLNNNRTAFMLRKKKKKTDKQTKSLYNCVTYFLIRFFGVH